MFTGFSVNQLWRNFENVLVIFEDTHWVSSILRRFQNISRECFEYKTVLMKRKSNTDLLQKRQTGAKLFSPIVGGQCQAKNGM